MGNSDFEFEDKIFNELKKSKAKLEVGEAVACLYGILFNKDTNCIDFHCKDLSEDERTQIDKILVNVFMSFCLNMLVTTKGDSFIDTLIEDLNSLNNDVRSVNCYKIKKDGTKEEIKNTKDMN